MIKSMTAFGREEASAKWGKLNCELRAVNHRYLELSIKLPKELRSLEMDVRSIINQSIKRGKVECTLLFEAVTKSTAFELDENLVNAYIEAAQKISARLPVAAPLSVHHVLSWPGVTRLQESDYSAVKQSAIDLVRATLDEFIVTREREGSALKKMLLERCDSMAKIVDQQRSESVGMDARLREKLAQKLQQISAQPDPSRLEQEIVYAAQKMDINEEMDRLDAHIAEVRSVLSRAEPIGRRLDFLMQELNREANTLGSKSQGVSTQNHPVELKVLIEQMREQVQNIE